MDILAVYKWQSISEPAFFLRLSLSFFGGFRLLLLLLLLFVCCNHTERFLSLPFLIAWWFFFSKILLCCCWCCPAWPLYFCTYSKSLLSFIAVMRVNNTHSTTATAYGRAIRVSNSFDRYSRERFTIWFIFAHSLSLFHVHIHTCVDKHIHQPINMLESWPIDLSFSIFLPPIKGVTQH